MICDYAAEPGTFSSSFLLAETAPRKPNIKVENGCLVPSCKRRTYFLSAARSAGGCFSNHIFHCTLGVGGPIVREGREGEPGTEGAIGRDYKGKTSK